MLTSSDSLNSYISVISVISVGLYYTHADREFCPTERTERTEIFAQLRGAFPLFLLFLWDFIILKQVESFSPTEITEITEIFAPTMRSISVISVISVGLYYTQAD